MEPKELYYFRHSTEDGPNKSTGPEGLKKARLHGRWFAEHHPSVNLCKLFFGPEPRNAQTALGFIQGYVGDAAWSDVVLFPDIQPVILEFGDDDLFDLMTSPIYFRPVADEIGDYEAVINCHTEANVKLWAATALDGIKNVFGKTKYGEQVAAFGHSPMIQFGIAGLLKNLSIPTGYKIILEMECVLFRQDEEGDIAVVEKIFMPA